MRTYILEVASENPIPHDVLIEHLAVALRDFEFAGFTSIALRGTTQTLEHKMAHPFDNPANVVFDDDTKLEEYTGPNGGLPTDPYPLTTRVIDALQERMERNNG